MRQILLGSRHGFGADITLEAAVEILIRIVFRGIGREIKDFDFITMISQPGRYFLGVMNT